MKRVLICGTLFLYEAGPDEMIEKILCSIEKQALVQVIIREFAKHLVPDYYIFVASVSCE